MRRSIALCFVALCALSACKRKQESLAQNSSDPVKPVHMTCYSGGKIVYQGTILDNNGKADFDCYSMNDSGYFFFHDVRTSRSMRIRADCVVNDDDPALNR